MVEMVEVVEIFSDCLQQKDVIEVMVGLNK
jgi:hypothetical protein